MLGPQASFPVGGVTLEPDAEECWDLAARFTTPNPQEPARSFTSLLLALVHASNAWSRWLAQYAEGVQLDLEAMYRAIGFSPARLRTLRGPPPVGDPSQQVQVEAWTRSVQAMADGAFELVKLSGGTTLLGVRHLLGAYFYRLPSDHTKEMQDWGFDLKREGSALLRQIRQRTPSEEKSWVDYIRARLMRCLP